MSRSFTPKQIKDIAKQVLDVPKTVERESPKHRSPGTSTIPITNEKSSESSNKAVNKTPKKLEFK
jgi:hypothetical protein